MPRIAPEFNSQVARNRALSRADADAHDWPRTAGPADLCFEI